MGSYQTLDLIETFMSYHESIRQCICIVYDPQHSALSGMAIKAVKLRDSFMTVYKQGGAGSLTLEKLKAANVAWQDVFEEIPVHIHNSALASALMLQIEPPAIATQVCPLTGATHLGVQFLNCRFMLHRYASPTRALS